MSEIHEYVLRGGQTITAGQIAAFRDKLPFLNVKAETVDAPDFPALPGQIRFLARFVEDTLDGAYGPEDLPAVAEAVFALRYLLKDVDIIPDSVPGSGYSDDAAILRAVLSSHAAEFEKFATQAGMDWAAVSGPL